MTTLDFNLLITLDAVLAEGSVAHAAQRLRLSASSRGSIKPELFGSDLYVAHQ